MPKNGPFLRRRGKWSFNRWQWTWEGIPLASHPSTHQCHHQHFGTLPPGTLPYEPI